MINLRALPHFTLHGIHSPIHIGSRTISIHSNKFKNLPIIPSVLKHIQSIGVGIPPRRRRRLNRKRQTWKSDDETSLLSNYEEGLFLSRRDNHRSNANSIHRNPSYYNKNNNHPKNGTKHKSSLKAIDSSSTSTEHKVSWKWMPPPPFAKSGNHPNGKDIIKRRPVKIAGVWKFGNNDNINVGGVGEGGISLPETHWDAPEVAIIGRSNVGKSTLLNALLYGNQNVMTMEEGDGLSRRGRRRIMQKMPRGKKAITSEKPGETQEITFYNLSSTIESKLRSSTKSDSDDKSNASICSLVLVDLPGYGFSFSSDERRLEWRSWIQSYMLGRGKYLKRLLLLLDARHGLKNEDIKFIDDAQRMLGRKETLPPIQLVLTKCDLVSQQDLARQVSAVKVEFSDLLRRESSSLPIMLVSAKPGIGFNNVSKRHKKLLGGVLELQREIASVVPHK